MGDLTPTRPVDVVGRRRSIGTVVATLFSIVSGTWWIVHLVLDQIGRVQTGIQAIGQLQKPNLAERMILWVTGTSPYIPAALFVLCLGALCLFVFLPTDSAFFGSRARRVGLFHHVVSARTSSKGSTAGSSASASQGTQKPTATTPSPGVSATSNPVPTLRKKGDRVFVDGTPLELLKQFHGKTQVQAERAIAPYFGKWLRVTGPVNTVKRSGGRHVITYLIYDHHIAVGTAELYFEQSQSAELERLVQGSKLSAVGKISVLRPCDITLRRCEVVYESR